METKFKIGEVVVFNGEKWHIKEITGSNAVIIKVDMDEVGSFETNDGVKSTFKITEKSKKVELKRLKKVKISLIKSNKPNIIQRIFNYFKK